MQNDFQEIILWKDQYSTVKIDTYGYLTKQGKGGIDGYLFDILEDDIEAYFVEKEIDNFEFIGSSLDYANTSIIPLLEGSMIIDEHLFGTDFYYLSKSYQLNKLNSNELLATINENFYSYNECLDQYLGTGGVEYAN